MAWRISGSLLAVLMAVLMGCERQATTAPGTVALLDMDTVLKTLGRDQTWSRSMAIKQQELQARWAPVAKELGDQVSALQTSLDEKRAKGERPSAEEERNMADLQRRLDGERQALRAELQRFQQQMITQFRQEVGETAKTVAQERGMAIVMIRDERVLVKDNNSDITDDVINALSRQPGMSESPGATPGTNMGMEMNPSQPQPINPSGPLPHTTPATP